MKKVLLFVGVLAVGMAVGYAEGKSEKESVGKDSVAVDTVELQLYDTIAPLSEQI